MSKINVGERCAEWIPAALFGYARISTADQNPDHQIDPLLRAGVDRDAIHLDKTRWLCRRGIGSDVGQRRRCCPGRTTELGAQTPRRPCCSGAGPGIGGRLLV
ncbi:hypothetical protein E1295_44450 [Nonomuraea mesophila]|uniref:Resolvase/invertase-type recombinase catalytic domain-containing protein n=1 Tax=Nonomuraea mesophila TaxID=2530382 RepID=A0A4R5E6L3_9ACTN|nr:hypothetical protein E1295_44450 [Nonomuraea mesophila]